MEVLFFTDMPMVNAMKSIFLLSEWSLLLVTTIICTFIVLPKFQGLNEVEPCLAPPLLEHLPYASSWINSWNEGNEERSPLNRR